MSVYNSMSLSVLSERQKPNLSTNQCCLCRSPSTMSTQLILELTKLSLHKNDLYDILIYYLTYIARNNSLIMSELNFILQCNISLLIIEDLV